MTGFDLFTLTSLSNVAIPNPASNTVLYGIYYYGHYAAIYLTVLLLLLCLRAKPSRAQVHVISFSIGAIIYSAGYIEEIAAHTAEGFYLSCITQYLGEFLVFLALMLFVGELCRFRIPKVIFFLQFAYSATAMFALTSTLKTGLFYKSVGVHDEQMISRPEIVHGPFFYLTVLDIILVSCWLIVICVREIKRSTPVQRRRINLIIIALLMIWLPYLLTLSGVTQGYEIPAIGIVGAAICLFLCFNKYGFFDSQVLAGENALSHSHEGILIIDADYRIRYQNDRIVDFFGDIPEGNDLINHPYLGAALKGEIVSCNIDGKYYEFFTDLLKENEYIIGKMLWVSDETERHETMQQIQYAAIHDSLTGLYNRNRFQQLVEADIIQDYLGTLVMLDMDNFKAVNDKHGHQTGDKVLSIFADVLRRYPEEVIYSSRMGGDEYCIFIRGCVDKQKNEKLLEEIFTSFDWALSEAGLHEITTLSAGGVPATKEVSFKTLYAEADKSLYYSKTSGKHRYVIT